MHDKVMDVQLGRYATKCILQALAMEEDRLNRIGMASVDEDEVADVANDLVGLRGVIDFMNKKAVITFGDAILNFGKDPL